MRSTIRSLAIALALLVPCTETVFAVASTNYALPSDVQAAGGGRANSTNYVLDDTAGQPNAGESDSTNYTLNAGYWVPDDTYIAIGCDATAYLGSTTAFGQLSGSGTCTVATNDPSGYQMSWKSGTNTNNGLLASWKMDETTGIVAYDTSGYGNDGDHFNTPANSATVPSTYFSSRSLLFSAASSEYIEATDFLGSSTALTACIWAKQSSTSTNKALIGQWDDGSDTSWALGQESSISVNYTEPGGTSGYTTGGESLSTSWKHVCFVFNGSATGDANRLKIYVNGNRQDIAFNGISVPSSLRNSAAPITIGRLQGVGRYFDGNLDEARVYERALSEDEIDDLASLAPPGSMVMSGSQVKHFDPYRFAATGSLLAHWKVDEIPAGGVTGDSSGNGFNGTPNGTGGGNNLPQPSTIVPSTGTGVTFNSIRSLDFDGTDDYSTFGNILNMNTDFTVSAWVRPDAIGTNFDSIVGKSGNASDWDLLINTAGGNKYAFYLTTTNGNFNVQALTSAQANVWKFITVTWDKAGGNLRMYVDGVLENTTTSVTGNRVTNSNAFCMGQSCHWTNRWFNGKIDEIRVYGRLLTAAEIKALFGKPQTWSVASTETMWGGRLRSTSTDTDFKWSTEGASSRWIHIGDGDYKIVSRNSATDVSGSTEILEFRAEIGSSANATAGTYKTSVVVTTTSL